MKKFFVLMVAFVLMATGAAIADQINLPDAQGCGLRITADEKVGANNLVMRMTCSIDKLFFYDAETPKGRFTVLYNPAFYFGGNYGAPQLPVITRLIQIPFGAECKVEVKGYDEKEYDLAAYGIKTPLFPRQPSAPKDGSEVPFVYEKSAYITRGYNGLPFATIEDIGTMRHMRLAYLAVSPIKYDPVANKITVYNNLKIEITMNGGNLGVTKSMHSTHASPAFAWMDKLVTVPKALKAGKASAPQGYVIVTDPAFKDAMAPFAALKKQQGFKVLMVTTDRFGTGAAITEPLKAYLADLYNNPTEEMPAPSYVLFVGDHEQIPAFKGKTGSHITDLYFATVTQGDFLPEFLTGRFSAQNLEQLQPQIDKTMEYEKGEFADPSFIQDAVLVAGWDSTWARSHGWPHINYAAVNYFNADHGFKNVNKYLSAGSQQNVADIISKVSKGVSYLNYTAHGSSTSWADPSFTISNIQQLENKGKYPLVVGNCCLTSKFEVGTCFAEAWLRAKDAGAIGYVGGTNSTYWDEDFWWGVGLHAIVKPNDQGVPPAMENTGRGALDSLFETNGVSNAAFVLAGNLAVESSTSTRKQYYWEVYHLMGDPSLRTHMGNF